MLRRIQILVIISIAMLAGCNSVKEEFTKLSQGDVVDVDDGKCLILTAESEAHPVGVCVYRNRYSFHVGEKKFVYSKLKFNYVLRERLSSFIQLKKYPRAKLFQ